MNKIILLFTIINTLCLVVSVHGQVNYSKSIRANTTRDIPEIQQIELLKNLISENTPVDTLGLIHYAISFRYYRLNQMLYSEQHAKLAKRYFEESLFTGYQLPNIIGKIGDTYFQRGMDKEALKYYQILDTFNIDHPKAWDALANAKRISSEIYQNRNDLQSAFHIIESTRHIIDSFSYDQQSIIYMGYSILYSRINDINSQKLARESIQKSIELNYDPIRKVYINQRRKANQLQQLAFLALKNNKVNEAKSLYQEAATTLSKNTDIHSKIVKNRALLNTSFSYEELGLHQEALRWAQKAIAKNIEAISTDHLLDIDAAYAQISKMYGLLNQADSSYFYAQKSLDLLDSFGSESTRCHLCTIEALAKQIKILHTSYTTRNSEKEKSLIVNLISRIKTVSDLFIHQSILSESAIDIKSTLSLYYSLIIDIAFDMNEPSIVWEFSEKSKNLLLLENIINDNLLEHEKAKLRELRNKEIQLDLAIQTNPSNHLKNEIQNNRLDQIKLRQAIQENIDISALNVISANEIKNGIGNKEVIQYQFTDTYLYALTISKLEVKMYKLSDIDELETRVRGYLNELNKTSNHHEDLDKLNNQLFSLYKILLGALNLSSTELIIIPDNTLHSVSFESLIVDKNLNKYLIHDYDIHYQLSGSIYKKTESNTNEIEYVSLFKPSYLNQIKLSPLTFSDLEVQEISNHVKTQLFTTKEEFRSELEVGQLIHFSGHAIVDSIENNNSFLSFGKYSDQKGNISLKEIYNQKSKAHLIVLSACDTGKGNILKGEGISNLARGFMYSGIHSVVSTLWQVNDQSTAHILSNFYSFLQQGKNKSSSLRQAKLDYLSTADDHLRHPYYWSSLIMTGDNSTLSFTSSSFQNRAVIFLLAFSSFLILIYTVFFKHKVLPPK